VLQPGPLLHTYGVQFLFYTFSRGRIPWLLTLAPSGAFPHRRHIPLTHNTFHHRLGVAVSRKRITTQHITFPPMALAIKTRHRRNNKLAVGKVAVGTDTHRHTAPTHILPGRRSGYKARRYSDTYGIAI
jgi:hypothetical protein